jgi:hypothetical protein
MSIKTDIYVIPLGPKGKRIELQKEEFILLKELLKHRTIHSSDVHEIYEYAVEIPRHPGSISRRLTNLVKAGVLHRMYENVSTTRAQVKKYYYKIGLKGLKALADRGELPPDQVETLNKQLLRLRIPKAHNIAASSLANKVWLEGMRQKIINFNHFRGSEDERLLSDFKVTSEGENVIPDWVFEKGNRTIYLEMDSGRQHIKVIEHKIERYIKYASTTQREVTVIFSVMDGSVNNYVSSDRTKRVSSLKESMPPTQEWPKNFSIYVLPAERTANIAVRILQEYEPLTSEYRGYVIDEWIDKWKQHERSAKITILNPTELYTNTNKELYADRVVQMKKGNKSMVYGLVYAEEGSVNGYQRIRANYHRTLDISGVQLFNELLVIYRNFDTADSDIHGMNWNNTWFSNRNTWGGTEKLRYPNMLKPISIYRKEEAKFE